jgi:hypothetical protein
LWQELDMLCGLGLGLAPVAPEVCALLRMLVGADAAALFWMDGQGLPEGFHHEDSPASAQDLFLNEFRRLFVGPHETNVLALARPDGPRVGRLMAPDARYFRSNSYNLLVRASGHHHTLDLRVEAQGRTRAIAALFRAPGKGFGDAEAALLERASASLARAFPQAPPASPWDASLNSPVGHVLFDAAHQQPQLADTTAIQLLRQANLLGLGVHGTAAMAVLHDLPRRLGKPPHGAERIPMPGGWLAADSHTLHPVAGGAQQLLVTLQLLRPRGIGVVRRVFELPLSPLQREIALLAGLGHARTDCAERTGVGSAALKKHLRTIFAATGTSGWDDLGHTLRT